MKKSSFKKSLAMFLAILMLITSVPILAFATDESGVKPADKTTLGQPFVENNPSDIYRIPCMVTLDDGTIVTAADARWNGGMDGGGNDTIVSRSTDNGIHWDYTMVNYYPDNGNFFNMASTSVCDSELVTDGKNVYMLTVFFPAGYALNYKSANNQVKSGDTAFAEINGVQRVKLFKNGESGSYNYYVGDFNAAGATGRAPIMNNDGSETGYYADHDYYIYNGTSKTGGNLFYSDGEFQTAKVNFLLFRKSTDGGATWSDFTPVPAKNSSEAFFGVGPGRGVYDKDHNRLIFSTYTWDGSDRSQRSSFIYTDDEGATWHRSPDFPDLDGLLNGNWSSESTLVQLDANRLRCFVRNGWKRMEYADAVWNENTQKYEWPDGYKDLYLQINGEPKPGDIGNDSGCMLSALKYSEKLQYNGNYYTAIFISTPRLYRANGVIYTVLLDDKYNVVNIDSSKKANDKQLMHTITSEGIYFGYSCLTELKDGKLGLLYEINGANDLKYQTFDANKVSGCRLPDYVGKTYTVDLNKGDLRTFYVDTDQVTMYDTNKPENTNPNYVATQFTTRQGVNIQLGDGTDYSGAKLNGKNALYDFEKTSDGKWNIYSQGVYLSVVERGMPSSSKNAKITILSYNKDGKNYFQLIDERGEALCYYRTGSNINTYDLSTAYGNDGAQGGKNIAVDRDRDISLFEIFRPLELGETAVSSAIPGYVPIKSLDELATGKQYLIGCQTDNGYFVLYPSMSTTNTYSHSAKIIGTNNTGFFMSVNAQLKGSTTIVAGKDTYIFNVSDFENEILGVVDYDPVIYTHGGTTTDEMCHTEVGQFIADGTFEGEKETHFSIRPEAKGEYKVVSIKALSAPDSNGNLNSIPNASIQFNYDEAKNDGILSGVLPLANTKDYTNYQKGEYVTLKTVVEDSQHNRYTQTDRLYVASNPVAGHVMVTATVKGKGVNAMTYMLANNSYGNTVSGADAFGVGYKHNAKRMYSKYFNGGLTKNTSSEPVMYGEGNDWNYTGNSQSKSETTKVGGVFDKNQEAKYGVPIRCVKYTFDKNIGNSNPNANSLPVAYYYYDVSDVENSQGIVEPKKSVNSNGTVSSTFSIQLSRMASHANGQNSAFGGDVVIDYGEYSDESWGKTVERYSKDSSVKQLDASGGASLTNIDNPFGSGTYKYEQFDTQQSTVDVNCQVSSLANNATGNLKGALVYAESYNSGKRTPRTVATLPFEILICNKQTERAAYKKTVEHVLKSTSFTTSTWKKYVDSTLAYEEYLNNYTLLTKESKVEGGESLAEKINEIGNPADNYEHMQISANFGIVKTEIDNNESTYNAGIDFSGTSHYTPSTFTEFETKYEAADTLYDEAGQNVEIIKNSPMGQIYDWSDPKTKEQVLLTYGGDGIRSETPGYKADKGIYADTTLGSADREDIQIDIENKASDLATAKSNLKIAADDSAYVAVKELYSRVDKTAYTDGGASVDAVITNYDDPSGYANDKIYLLYNNKAYVDVPSDCGENNPIDAAVTEALTQMTVNTNKTNVKKYNVDVYEGENETTSFHDEYNYGDLKYLDFSEYFNPETETAECIVTSKRVNEKGEIVATKTTVNLSHYANSGYVVPVLIQNDIEFRIYKAEKTAKQVTVTDYYGTVLGILTGDTITISGDTVTDGIQTVKAKNSPKYSFEGWSLPDGNYEVTEAMVVSQHGTLIVGGCEITANGGTVNTLSTYTPNHLNMKMTFAADGGNTIWTKTVNGKTVIASYEPNFVHFSSGADAQYNAYPSIDALPESVKAAAQAKTPFVSAVGYTANNKFTMSVDYTAPLDKVVDKDGNPTSEFAVEVLDAGVVFSSTSPDNLVKGGEGTVTYAAPRIAHWSSDPANAKQSGTFTMSKTKGIEGSFMRAYVSYTTSYNGKDIPFVVYSDTIYMCQTVDGKLEVKPIN